MEAGIEFVSGPGEAAARELNAAFFNSFTTDRPWLTVKLALSIDGAITDHRRSSAWLTSSPARRAVHRMRAAVDAIAVGIGTALADDPALTVRGRLQPRVPPVRVVFDRDARLPPNSQLARTAKDVPTVVIAERSDADRTAALRAEGVDVILTASPGEGLKALRARGIRSVLVEGGAGISSALLSGGLVDRLVIFQAPVLLGSGSLNGFAALPSMLVRDAPRLAILERRTFGDDLMTVYGPAGEGFCSQG